MFIRLGDCDGRRRTFFGRSHGEIREPSQIAWRKSIGDRAFHPQAIDLLTDAWREGVQAPVSGAHRDAAVTNMADARLSGAAPALTIADHYSTLEFA